MILLFFTFFISRKLDEDIFNSVNLTVIVSYIFIAINKIFEVIKFIIRKIKKVNSSKNNIPKKFECFYNSFNYLFYIFSLATGKKIRIEKAEQKKTEQKTDSISTQEEIAEDAYTSILNKIK